MSDIHQPWIVTDARLPCIVVVGLLRHSTSIKELEALIEKKLNIVSDVYNGTAFALNKECSGVFRIRNNSEAAIIFLPKNSQYDDSLSLTSVIPIESSLDLIRDILSQVDDNAEFFPTKLEFEVTGEQRA